MPMPDEALMSSELEKQWTSPEMQLLLSQHKHSRKLILLLLKFEPVHEKTNNLGFRPGRTQTRLYSDSIKLEA